MTEFSASNASRFLALPRELRDLVHHHLFQSGYVLKAHCCCPQSTSSVPTSPKPPPGLPLKAYYRTTLRTSTHNASPLNSSWEYTDPTWLLTCKSIFYEARRQFARNAIWLVDEDDLARPTEPHAPWLLSFPHQAVHPINLELRMDAWEVVHTRLESSNSLFYALRHHDFPIERVRIVTNRNKRLGETFSLGDMENSCGYYCGEIMKHFREFGVQKWHLAVDMNHEDQRAWILYEWTGSHEDRVLWEDVEVLANDNQTLKEATKNMSSLWREETMDYWKELERIHCDPRRECWKSEEEKLLGTKREKTLSGMEYFRQRREWWSKVERRRLVTEKLRLRDL